MALLASHQQRAVQRCGVEVNAAFVAQRLLDHGAQLGSVVHRPAAKDGIGHVVAGVVGIVKVGGMRTKSGRTCGTSIGLYLCGIADNKDIAGPWGCQPVAEGLVY